MTEIIYVENIKCGGCINSIKNGLTKVDGVTTVEIIKEQEMIKVDGTSIDRKNLVEKLTKLGYPERGENTALAKAKSYVSCAIGNIKL